MSHLRHLKDFCGTTAIVLCLVILSHADLKALTFVAYFSAASYVTLTVYEFIKGFVGYFHERRLQKQLTPMQKLFLERRDMLK